MDFIGHAQIANNLFLLIGLVVEDGVEERERRLLGERLEGVEIPGVKGLDLAAAGNDEHAQELVRIDER